VGVNSDAEIHTRRKQFRFLVSTDLPVELSYLRSLRVEDFYGCVANKIELQSLVAQPGSKLSLLLPRVRTRDFHLMGNLTQLTCCSLIISSPHIIRNYTISAFRA
jgi:hypothetical protein